MNLPIVRVLRRRPPPRRLAGYKYLHPKFIAREIGEARLSIADASLELQVALQQAALAVPKRHPLGKLKELRLRDLVDASLVWFPRRESPAFYDRLMHKCFRGGLKTPRIVQEAVNEATILSLVSHGMGVGFVNGTARSRCPLSVVILSVVDLNMPLPLALVSRKDNVSPLLRRVLADLRNLREVQALATRRSPPR